MRVIWNGSTRQWENEVVCTVENGAVCYDKTSVAQLSGAQTLTNKALSAVTNMTLASTVFTNIITSRALTDADNGKILKNTTGSDYTLTVPAGLILPFSCGLKALGAGKLIAAVSGGNVLKNIDAHTSVAAAGGYGSIDWETGTDVWLLGRTVA